MFVANQKKINPNPVGVTCITHLHRNFFSYLLGQIPTFFLRSLFCCSFCSYQHVTPTGFRLVCSRRSYKHATPTGFWFCCFRCNYKHTTSTGVQGTRVLKKVSFLCDFLRNPRLRCYVSIEKVIPTQQAVADQGIKVISRHKSSHPGTAFPSGVRDP